VIPKMKRCPTCQRTYTDETVKFCRVDGVTLVNASAELGESEATRVLPESRATGEAPTEIFRNTGEGKLTTSALKPGPPAAAIGAPRRSISSRKLALIITLMVLIVVVPIVILVAGYISYRHARDTEVAIDSIAVLPFENQTQNADSDYLSDGVTESIINSLTQLPNLKVIARSSVFRYKGKQTDPFVAGKELGVRAVLVGRMMQHGDSITISTELVDVRDNKQLWGEQYNEKVSDLLAVQREIAQKISSNLRLRLSGAEQSRITKHYTESPEAYQLYLKGRFYWNKRTGEALKTSVEYFNQAIEKDPNYALAYAGMADAYNLMPVYSAGSAKEYLPKARTAAMKALQIDDTLAEAHASLAIVLGGYDRNFAESNREFQRAIELNPNYPTAHHWYGGNLAEMGRFDEGIAELKRAQELDPLSLIINADLGEVYTWARQYDKAIEQLRKTIEMDQSFYYAHWHLGLAYALKGSIQEGIAEYQKARSLDDDPWVLALLGRAYAASGKKDEALKILDQLKENAKRRYVREYIFAVVYAGLDEKDQAFQWLEKGYQDRAHDLIYIKVDPLLDNLRSDPRFADLVRRVGLPQ
jgi:TolB-like protein/Tfp pilus assembly protein PilF